MQCTFDTVGWIKFTNTPNASCWLDVELIKSAVCQFGMHRSQIFRYQACKPSEPFPTQDGPATILPFVHQIIIGKPSMGSGAHFCTEELNSILTTEVLHHLFWNGFLERLVECFPLKHSKLSVALTRPGSQQCQDVLPAGEDTQLRDLWNMLFDVWQSCMEEEWMPCLCSTTESWC